MKKHTGLSVPCSCGGKATIFQGGWGYHAHCPHCGKLSFFRSDVLLEKVRLGGKKLCSHNIAPKPCKGGEMSWCSICRVKTFLPAK